MAICPKCKGRKTLVADLQMSDSDVRSVDVEIDCGTCKGTGEVDVAACATCNDSRTVVQKHGSIGVEVDCPDCSAPTAA